MHAPCEPHSLHWELMKLFILKPQKVDGRGDLTWLRWLILFSGACLCDSDASFCKFLSSPGPVDALKEERFIQVTLRDHERAVIADLSHVKEEIWPSVMDSALPSSFSSFSSEIW